MSTGVYIFFACNSEAKVPPRRGKKIKKNVLIITNVMNSYTGLGYQQVYYYLKNTTILEGQQPFLQKLIIKILGKQYDNLLQNMCQYLYWIGP